ncbi:MAG: ISNCY family transposase [Candidatus Omnitrophota bacterium]|nr:ISNCY family transposase [Candidatus Omnitrophota bacterium]
MMEERLTMTTRELDRLKVIHQVLQHKLTWPQAALQLARSVRQIGRLCARVRTEGHKGVIHRLRGQPSNHQLPAGRLAKALELIRSRYPDFGPTFANEKLRERHHLVLSSWTLRQGMIQAGLWKPRRQQVIHRAWRPRRACVGELVQLDGSDHAWFEARAPRCVLVLYIDDATSRLLDGAFVAVEDTVTLLRTTQTYLTRSGRPVAFYVDKDSIYKVNRQASIEEQLQDSAPLTQFTRAMRELGVEVICAHSPQAKGRVERSFDTHQDRLVKELRLARISDKESATRFLHARYFPAHNRRFAIEPANATDAHRPLLPTQDLAAILSVQTPRTVERDFTLRLQNRFFQLLPDQPVRVRPKDPVLIEQRLDGTTHLRAKGRYLSFTPIAKPAPRPPSVAALAPRRDRRRHGWVTRPAPTHPWKRAWSERRRRRLVGTAHARTGETPMPPPVVLVDPGASQRPTHRDPSASNGRCPHVVRCPPFPPRPPSITTTTTP